MGIAVVGISGGRNSPRVYSDGTVVVVVLLYGIAFSARPIYIPVCVFPANASSTERSVTDDNNVEHGSRGARKK